MRYFLMPIGIDNSEGIPMRLPKYAVCYDYVQQLGGPLFGVPISYMDYGGEEVCIVAADTGIDMSVLPDVYEFPPDLDAKLKQKDLTEMTSWFLGFKISVSILSLPNATFRQIIRMIIAIFIKVQELSALRPRYDVPFFTEVNQEEMLILRDVALAAVDVPVNALGGTI